MSRQNQTEKPVSLTPATPPEVWEQLRADCERAELRRALRVIKASNPALLAEIQKEEASE